MCCKNNYLLSIFFYKIIIGFLNLPFIGCAESLLLLVWKCYLLSCWTCWQHFQQTLVLISFNLLKLTQTSVGFHFSRVIFSTEVFWKRFVDFVLLEKRPIDATRGFFTAYGNSHVNILLFGVCWVSDSKANVWNLVLIRISFFSYDVADSHEH